MSTISKRTRIEALIMTKFRYQNKTKALNNQCLNSEAKRTEFTKPKFVKSEGKRKHLLPTSFWLKRNEANVFRFKLQTIQFISILRKPKFVP